MTIASEICNSFKQEILVEVHNFTGGTDDFKLALYDSDTAVLGKATTAYAAPTTPSADPTSTREVTTGGSSGYTGGGNTLVSTTPVVNGDSGCCLFATTSWGSSASFTARGCLIYNDDQADKAVCSINFGADKTVTTGTFTIEFPAQTAGNAIIEIT